jgi:hypothetical protein
MACSFPLNHHSLHSGQHSYRSRRTGKRYTVLFSRTVCSTRSSLSWYSQFHTDQRIRKINSVPTQHHPPTKNTLTVTVGGRYSSVGTVTRLRAVNPGIVLRFSAGDKRFYSKARRRALASIQPPTFWVPMVPLPTIKRQGSWSDNSPPPSAKNVSCQATGKVYLL